MLSTADVDAMRATLEESLPDSCAVVRGTYASDGAGGRTQSGSSSTTVACRVSPTSLTLRNAELITGERLTAVAPWTITLPAETDVTVSDRITSGSRTFEVAAVLDPRSWELGRRVLCEEIL
jgi:head-tail adaptor